MFNYSYWKSEFHHMADESNDSSDHDELHAAAEICEAFVHMGFPDNSYVQRWLEGLTRR